MNSRQTRSRPIGGFFGLGLLDMPPRSDSIWQVWTAGRRIAATAWTARAALTQLVEWSEPSRVWMPAFMCREVVDAIPLQKVQFYPIDEELSPDVRTLRQNIRPHDFVFCADYFGRLPSNEFLEFVRQTPDVIWVEDRAQCLWTDAPAWGTWILYSPRKLVGVADGGILVSSVSTGPPPKSVMPTDPAAALPELMRFEDEFESGNDEWYKAFKAREARFCTEHRSMSRLTTALLQRIPIKPLIEARIRNFSYLERELADYRLIQSSLSGTAPFGFVIAVEDGESLRLALMQERLFCARHWPLSALRISATEFAWEHRLAQQIITLPCDHRYEEASLARLVEAVRRLSGGTRKSG